MEKSIFLDEESISVLQKRNPLDKRKFIKIKKGIWEFIRNTIRADSLIKLKEVDIYDNCS